MSRKIIFAILFLMINLPLLSAAGEVVKVGVYENHPKIFTDEQGRVWVEDNPGGGSVFIVEIPIEKRGERKNVNIKF